MAHMQKTTTGFLLRDYRVWFLACVVGWFSVPASAQVTSPFAHTTQQILRSAGVLPVMQKAEPDVFGFPTQSEWSSLGTVARPREFGSAQSARFHRETTIPKTVATPKRWWSAWYLLDWGLALGIGVGGSLAMEWVTPPVREWSPGDLTLTRPWVRDSLFPLSMSLAVGVPFLGLALAQIHVREGHNFHHALLGWTEALALTAFLTQILQVTTGYLRPDWFERCRPQIESLQCTGDPGVVLQGRRSFPSLEASLAWAGGVYLSLYLAGQMHPWNHWHTFWKVPVLLLPLAGATLISLIPILESRNHPGDVAVGALIGTGIAILAYHLNFYPLWHRRTGSSRARTRVSWAPLFVPQGGGVMVHGDW